MFAMGDLGKSLKTLREMTEPVMSRVSRIELQLLIKKNKAITFQRYSQRFQTGRS